MFISTRHKLATIPDQPEFSANGSNIKLSELKHTKALALNWMSSYLGMNI